MKAFSLGKSIRQFGIMILAIILCLTSFSCVKNLNTPKLDDDSQFKIKFNKGDKYKSTLELSQSSTAVSCGHEINFSLSSKYTQNIEVLDVAEDGSGLLKITFLNLIMTLESPEEKRSFTFNARNPVWPDDRKHDDLFDLYPEMVDEHLLMKVSYKGKVLKVQGLEERNQRVLEKAKKKNKAFKSEWIVNQKALFSEEVEAIALENLWRFLPGDPTGKSGRWTKERIQSIGDDVYMYKDEIMLLEKTRESCTYKVISDFDSKTAKVESNTKSDSDEGFRTHDISTYQVNSKTNWPTLIKSSYQTSNSWKGYCGVGDDQINSHSTENKSVLKLDKIKLQNRTQNKSEISEADLFYAIRENDEETFYREIKHADINQVNEFGQNLLHEAVTHGQTKMGEALIAKGIDVNHRENKGQTPLHYAAVHGAFDLAKLILAKGGKLDIADTYGNQPLWTAVFNARGKYEMVELMMRYGADANHKNNSDRSPLDFANQIKDETLIKILTTK